MIIVLGAGGSPVPAAGSTEAVEVTHHGQQERREILDDPVATVGDAPAAPRHIDAAACTGEGYIELAAVFGALGFVVAGEVVGVTAVDDIKDDDIVKLEALGLVDGGDEDALIEDI